MPGGLKVQPIESVTGSAQCSPGGTLPAFRTNSDRSGLVRNAWRPPCTGLGNGVGPPSLGESTRSVGWLSGPSRFTRRYGGLVRRSARHDGRSRALATFISAAVKHALSTAQNRLSRCVRRLPTPWPICVRLPLDRSPGRSLYQYGPDRIELRSRCGRCSGCECREIGRDCRGTDRPNRGRSACRARPA